MDACPSVQDAEEQHREGDSGEADHMKTEEASGPGCVDLDRSVAEGPSVIPQEIVEQCCLGGRELRSL
jgi:hypothetical protein